ncbi:MAG TPA: tryptophan halogenase family protein [Steroidobacteraceae bacterium]|jgi:tryptophan halogenase|nr:tryptophan halogenase family protein [Steroidobacteraceae bacterium]
MKRVVIAGGGTAGWLAAAALSHQLGKILDITLIESDEIGTIGVGEATIPPIRVFHKLLQIDEQEFMRATAATFKLGISFENWGLKGARYIHSFGRNGQPTWMCEFHNFWLRSLELGVQSELGEYCFELQAAKADKFALSQQVDVNFAYHFDAGQYSKFLRRFSEGFGIKRVEGKIKEVKQNSTSGFIESLVLHSGQIVEGDLFIDCTGFRGLLIEQTLKTGYEDWSHWLPCDSAAAVQTELSGPAPPLTRAIAHDAGWRWCIPLQHRVGNGLVFSSQFLADDAAKEELVASIDGKPITAPRVLKFQTGRRREVWNKNCLALGLSSGFIEPLESTSIHLMMVGVTRLLHLFPFAGINQSVLNQYNEAARIEMEKTRDFVVLHYHATQRDDTPFWRHCRDMAIPDSLAQRIDLFKQTAYAYQGDSELFRTDSWTQVMLGQGIRPMTYHPAARLLAADELTKYLAEFRASIQQVVTRMPVHQDFVNQYCKASNSVWN